MIIIRYSKSILLIRTRKALAIHNRLIPSFLWCLTPKKINKETTTLSPYIGNYSTFRVLRPSQKSGTEICWCKSDHFVCAFQSFKNQEFWISGFFGISGHISGMKWATRYPLVSCPNVQIFRAYKFSKKIKIGFWNLWISVLFGQILGTKRAHQRSAIVKTTRFFRAFQIFKKVGVLAFWISGYFWISCHISGTKSATGGCWNRFSDICFIIIRVAA